MAYTRFTVTPTVSAGGVGYSQYDVVGGALQFKGVRRGQLQQILITVDSTEMANETYVLVLYDAQPSTTADNAPINPTDGANSDATKLLYTVQLTQAGNANAYNTGATYIARPTTEVALVSNESDGDIWGYVYLLTVPAGSDDFASTTGMTVSLVVDVR